MRTHPLTHPAAYHSAVTALSLEEAVDLVVRDMLGDWVPPYRLQAAVTALVARKEAREASQAP